MKFISSISISCILFILVSSFPEKIFAGPASTNYELMQYGFGSGGTENSASTNFSLFGQAGGLEYSNISSTNYDTMGGLTQTLQANVPPAPAFTNPATNYDRLKFIINTGDNPSDALFALAISSDDFVTTYYVHNDNTISTTANASDWQTYANWGGATGEYVRTLSQNTIYKLKVKAKRGNFTESGFGPPTSAMTSIPSLTFGISSANVAFDSLESGNAYTDNSKSTTLTTSTNAYNGYTVYGHETSPLSFNAFTIPDYAGTNGTPTNWTSTGFGYTTNDSSLAGGAPDRFTNGGPKYAGFTTSIPGDPVADHTTVIQDAPVVNEQFVVSYRVTGDSATKAGIYENTILYVVVPVY